MSKKIKLSALLLVIAFLLSVFAGCAASPQSPQSPPPAETRVFTDDAGREVEIPMVINTIGASGPTTQVILWTVAPEKMVNVAYEPEEIVKPFMPEEMQALPAMGQFYGATSNLNIEGLAKLAPDILLDIGTKSDNTASDMDSLQEQTSIPTLFIEASLENYPEMFRKLGDLVGEKEHGEALAVYTLNVLNDINEKAATITDDERVTVYYGVNADALYTAPVTSVHSGVINQVGGKNVVEVEINTTGAGSNISLENIIDWDPDVIILTNWGESYNVIPTDPAWQEVRAIKEGRVYEIPEGPYSWFSSPPSINRIIGFQWMGNLLYPEVYNYDMIAKAQEYYKLFYQFDLSEEQAKQLMGKSTFKGR